MTFDELSVLCPDLYKVQVFLDGLTHGVEDASEHKHAIEWAKDALLERLSAAVGPASHTADPKAQTQEAYDVALGYMLAEFLPSCDSEQEVVDAAYLKEYIAARKALSSSIGHQASGIQYQ